MVLKNSNEISHPYLIYVSLNSKGVSKYLNSCVSNKWISIVILGHIDLKSKSPFNCKQLVVVLFV